MISIREARDIIISVVALSFAFAIAQFGLGVVSSPATLVLLISFFAITLGLGFVLHELAHKFVALMFGAQAEFRMWMQGLVLALILSPLGIVIAAPGAVYIYARSITRMQNGLISLAGPLTNLVLSFIFIFLAVFFPLHVSVIHSFSVWGFAAYINVMLGGFNMLPIFPLDGSKIMDWNFLVWLAFTGIFVFMYLVVF